MILLNKVDNYYSLAEDALIKKYFNLLWSVVSLGVLGDFDLDFNEGMQIELQGHIGRFQVNFYNYSNCFLS